MFSFASYFEVMVDLSQVPAATIDPEAPLDAATRELMAPLVATLETAQKQLALVDDELAQLPADGPSGGFFRDKQPIPW